MSQLPPPNFGNMQHPMNPYSGYAGWPIPMQGTPQFMFGSPPVSSPSFPPGFPMNSLFPYNVPQYVAGFIPPNRNPLQANHVRIPSPATSGHHVQSHRHATTSQGKMTEEVRNKNCQNSFSQKEFGCEACQREFASSETLRAHLDSHDKCSFEGCTFEAARKVLKLHWTQVHVNGEKKKFNLDTPEEIEKWREERKRNYPTLANVEKKKEDEVKRRESGQVLKTRNFRHRRGQQRGGTFQRGRNNHFHNRSLSKVSPEEEDGRRPQGHCTNQGKSITGTEDKDRTTESPTKLENGEDPLSLVLGGHENGDETEDTESIPKKARLSTADGSTVPSGLSSLCSAYASDSDDGDETAEVNNNEHKESSMNDRTATSSNPGHERRAEQHITENKTKRQWVRSRKPAPKVHSNSMRMRKSTLLEKLLAPEIRHERNIILQCLRHIVKKNFFEVEGSPLKS